MESWITSAIEMLRKRKKCLRDAERERKNVRKLMHNEMEYENGKQKNSLVDKWISRFSLKEWIEYARRLKIHIIMTSATAEFNFKRNRLLIITRFRLYYILVRRIVNQIYIKSEGRKKRKILVKSIWLHNEALRAIYIKHEASLKGIWPRSRLNAIWS